MRRRLPALALLGCAGLSALGACASAPPEAGLTGAYVNVHEVEVVAGPETWETASVTDVLEVAERGDSLEVYVLLVQTNAHLCETDLPLGPAGAGIWEAETDWGCRLRLVAEADTLRLEDPDHACRRRLCGARAVLDGAAFPRPAVGPVGSRRVSR